MLRWLAGRIQGEISKLCWLTGRTGHWTRVALYGPLSSQAPVLKYVVAPEHASIQAFKALNFFVRTSVGRINGQL